MGDSLLQSWGCGVFVAFSILKHNIRLKNINGKMSTALQDIQRKTHSSVGDGETQCIRSHLLSHTTYVSILKEENGTFANGQYFSSPAFVLRC